MARGWRDTYYLLSPPAVGGEVQILQSVLGLPAHDLLFGPGKLSFFHLCGVAKIHFCLLDTAEMVYAPCSTGMAADFLLRKPNRRLGGPARLRLLWSPPESVLQETPLQPRVLFCSKNRKSSRNPVFIVPSEPVIECHREVRGRAT